MILTHVNTIPTEHFPWLMLSFDSLKRGAKLSDLGDPGISQPEQPYLVQRLPSCFRSEGSNFSSVDFCDLVSASPAEGFFCIAMISERMIYSCMLEWIY